MTHRLLLGDCKVRMADLEDGSVDLLLSDPPYGLEFMGKEWDRLGDIGKMSNPGIADDPGFKGFRLPSYGAASNVKCRKCRKWRWDHEGRKCECESPEFPNVGAVAAMLMQKWHEEWLAEIFRVLIPGGQAWIFSGSRTFHRLAMAMDVVGFRDLRLEAWNYASGFPKSLDVSKAMDRYLGCERHVLGSYERFNEASGLVDAGRGERKLSTHFITAPASDEAKAWDGWGTALKPAWEPIVVGFKP
jgi:DNA modification methylase